MRGPKDFILPPKKTAVVIVVVSFVALAVALVAGNFFGEDINRCANGICWFQRSIYIIVAFLGLVTLATPRRYRWIFIMSACFEILVLFAGVMVDAFPIYMCEPVEGLELQTWTAFGIPVKYYNHVIYGCMMILIVLSFFSKPKLLEQTQ